MDNYTDIFGLLNAILSSNEPDANSMQVYDAIALSAKHDKQVKALASYALLNMQMEFAIDTTVASTTTKTINGSTYCTIVVSKTDTVTSVTVTFAERKIWQARAFSGNTVFTCAVNDNVITISNAASTTPIILQFY